MIERIKLENGKYTFEYNTDTGELVCLRHGEEWRDFVGDKAVFALFSALYDKKEKMTNHSAVTLTAHEITRNENEMLRKALQMLLNKVNVVTAYWRHQSITTPKTLDELANRQIEVEDMICGRKTKDCGEEE